MQRIKSTLVGAYGESLYFDAPGGSPSAMQGSYRNSKRDRLRSGSRGPIGSNNAHHDSRTIEDLIRDCTQLGRNNYLARAIMNAHADHVVGNNITVEARTDDDDWNDQAEDMFAHWADQACDITGQQSLTEISTAIINRWDDSGGVLANKTLDAGGRLRLEMIDVVRLMNPSRASDSKYMHGGVELSESTGEPIKYHIADWNEQGTALDFNPKPYNAKSMLLVNNPRLQGVGQHRTAPRLASTIDRFETIETATTSTWKAYTLAAFTALAITRTNPEGLSTENELAQAMVQTGDASSVEDAIERGVWAPGSVMEMMPGEGIEQVKPEHPSAGFDTMLWTELMAICAEQGLPLELVFMRFIKNYSASRSAIAVAWKKIQADQTALIRRFLRPVYRAFIAQEQLAERLPRMPVSECYKCEFMMPTMPVLDPKAEVEGITMQMAAGLKLHEVALREMGGGDRKAFLRKHTIEQRENFAAGISYGKPLQTTRSETVIEDENNNTENNSSEINLVEEENNA